MHESNILDAIDSISLNSLTNEERALVLAFVKSETDNKRFAGSNLNKLILSGINELKLGGYRVSQNIKDYFQDFSEKSSSPKPFDVINKDEIDKFLEKMTSKKFEGDFFDDTFDFYHPTENLNADGVPRHRSDFNIA